MNGKKWPVLWGAILALVAAGHWVLPVPAARAQTGLVRRGASEIVERVSRFLGREGAKEVLEKTGREGIEAVLERAAREGGEEAVERVVRVAGAHGQQALRVLKSDPASLARVLDGLPPGRVKAALDALERESSLLPSLAKRYGPPVIEAELRHPGVGAKLFATLGRDAARLAERLTTEQTIRLSRYSREISALPAAFGKKLLAMVSEAPGKVLKALESSPNVLKACIALGIGVPVGLKAMERSRVETRPDGTRIEEKGILGSEGVGDLLRSVGRGMGDGLRWMLVLAGVAAAMVILLRGRFHVRGGIKGLRAPKE